MRSLLALYADVMGGRGAGCARDCSGRGDCLNGTCLCEIRYSGDECAGPNMPYHACIGGLFLLVAFVCAIQLTICIATEYRRLKVPTFLRACKVTTQKMLYLVVFFAALIRGAYFVSPSAFQEGWTTSLLSAYYPLLMSGSSLIVCFWAEVFHLRNIRWERPRFLSKSFLAFVTFNLISYSLLVAEVLTTSVYSDISAEKKTFYQHIFNGCYAVLIFIVVIFFLIYGVEVYFKLRGEFLKETKVCTFVQPRAGPSTAADGEEEVSETLVTKQGIQTDLGAQGTVDPRSVDLSQLHQSRLGLVSQALMLILIAGFLASETLGDWKTRVPVVSRNWHDLVFRLAEIGVALWFPCVLWNCMAPERLWLLNPRRLLARQLEERSLAALIHHPQILVDFFVLSWRRKAVFLMQLYHYWRLLWEVIEGVVFKREQIGSARNTLSHSTSLIKLDFGGKTFTEVKNAETDSLVGSETSGRDCWVCYDRARTEPLIRPCRCSGDMAEVHHDCLRRWLVESADSPDGLKCRVCNTPYNVQETNRVEWERGFTCSRWVKLSLGVVLLFGAGALMWIALKLGTGGGSADTNLARAMVAGVALIVGYIAVSYLGKNTIAAYQRAKVSSLKILTEPLTEKCLDAEGQVSIISKSIAVDMAPKAVLEKALKGDVK